MVLSMSHDETKKARDPMAAFFYILNSLIICFCKLDKSKFSSLMSLFYGNREDQIIFFLQVKFQ